MDIELRHLRALVAVAEEGSFTDAAARLGVSQAAVSRTVAQIERELGARLVHRTTRQVSLSETGEAFLVGARRTLGELERSIARIRGETDLVRFGYAWAGLGVHTTPVIRAWNRAHPAEPLRMVHLNRADIGLRGGLVDIAVARHEVGALAEVESAVVGHEARVCAVALDDALAEHASVTLADLRPHRVGSDRATGTTTAELWRHAGVDPPELVSTGDVDEWLERIAAGEVVGVTSEATAHHYPRPGVVFLPIVDAPPIEVRLVWRRDNRHPSTGRIVRHVAAAYAAAV